MDHKGQISVEVVLILGIMFCIVILVGPYVAEQNEFNSVLGAAKTGAMAVITNNATVNNSAPIRVSNIQIVGSGHDLTIRIDVSRTISTAQNQSIMNGTLSSIAALGYTWNTGGTPNDFSDDYILTSRHKYVLSIT